MVRYSRWEEQRKWWFKQKNQAVNWLDESNNGEKVYKIIGKHYYCEEMNWLKGIQVQLTVRFWDDYLA